MSSLRAREQESIASFVDQALEGTPGGDLLDYGSGDSPYFAVVEDAGYRYHAFDRAGFPASRADADVGDEDVLAGDCRWDAILCTQVIQYVPEPFELLTDFRWALKEGGLLVLTGPTCWPEVEDSDLWRFTRAGVRTIAEGAGFTVQRLETRFTVAAEGERFPVGYGLVATA